MNDYDPKKQSTFISYLDMNNLYGWAMSDYLPYEGFEQLKNVDKSDQLHEFKFKLHELHNDYPVAPEKLAVSTDMLSKYCKKFADKYEIKVGDVKKLIPNLGNRATCICICFQE